ncbi:MAG: NosD domain-containing protein [Candidatus Bathyarchaeia archaeon]|jgi:parallel beta-helix repeat protein
MIDKKVLFLVLAMLCLMVFGSFLFVAKASPAVIRVPLDYSTIQEAIDHANPGDTVSVSAGTYYENPYIDKNLTLTGENRETTILNASSGWYGIHANYTSVNITGFTIVNATVGIFLENCSDSTVSNNDVTGSNADINSQEEGIWLYACNNSAVTDNLIHNCGQCGLILCGHSSGDTVTINTITGCGTALELSGERSLIYHNNFVNNQNQTYVLDSFYNDLNDTYEGNYWSNYNGTDANQDGIGDTPYTADANNIDYYPLMGMFSQFEITEQGQTYTVPTICNSTITNFNFGIPYPAPISFNTTGPQDTDGFCRMVLPEAFFDRALSFYYTILVDGLPPLAQKELPLSNSTHIYLYFTFHNSPHNIIITIPEFPTMLCLLIIILTIPLVAVVRKRQRKTRTKQKQK